MQTVVLSHALYKPGMDVLEGKVNLIIPDNGNSDEILEELKQADAYILRIGKIDRKAIEQCPNLKVITRPGVGVDSVDVQAATEHGIPVVICPAVNAVSVAEHALTLILGLAKNLLESCLETRKGNFAVRNRYVSTELGGKTVSILGFGNIGRNLALMCSALGMDVVVYDPFVQKEAVEALGYRYVDTIPEAAALGDFVSLHMPSNDATRGSIDKPFFEAMKTTGYFINCARGDVVNEEDLIEALQDHKIQGAGLDVLMEEPMSTNHPLMKMDNVLVTPHMAAQTQETTKKTVMLAAESTLRILNGEKIDNVCNPEVYDHPRWRTY